MGSGPFSTFSLPATLKVVFVSHCLLDQNVRFPGIAVQPGPVTELASALAEAGIGLEQLPCPEMKYWGGIDRRLALLPLPEPLLGLVLPPFMEAYAWACARETRKTVRAIAHLRRSGYEAMGIIAMDDSPTCGLGHTLRMTPGLVKKARTSPDLAGDIPGLLEEGSGFFMGALKKKIEASGLNIPFFSFDPWADAATETARLIKQLAG